MQDRLHAPLLAIISGILPPPLTPVSSSARLKWRRPIMRYQTSDALGVGSGPDGGLTQAGDPHTFPPKSSCRRPWSPAVGVLFLFFQGCAPCYVVYSPPPTPRVCHTFPGPCPSLLLSAAPGPEPLRDRDTLNPSAALRVGTHPPKGSLLWPTGARAGSTPLQPLGPPLFPLSSFLTSSPNYVPPPLALDTQLAPSPLLCVPLPHSSGCWGMPSHLSMATS